MRILVTGASGFLGRPLCQRLAELGHEVTGASRATGLDVTHADDVRALVEDVRPEIIYHLAGPAFIPDSRKNPVHFTSVHIGGTVHLLEAARRQSPQPRVLLAATADNYAADPKRLPFDEDTPQYPETPYSAAKVAQEALGRAWWASYGLPVVCVRLFNLIGPGQDERYVASSFAKQAAAIALGLSEPRMEVGDLRVARDFVDWRDGLEAIRLAAESGAPGSTYNVCSGTPRRLQELLDFYFTVAGIDPEVESPAHLARPGQAMLRFGSNERLKRETGWEPTRELPETLGAIYGWWVSRLRDMPGVPAPR